MSILIPIFTLAGALLSLPSWLQLREGIAYEVSINGVADSGLRQVLIRNSRLVTLQRRIPETPAQLQQRIEEDNTLLANVLLSRGYYDAAINIVSDDKSYGKITIQADPGRLYTLNRIAVEITAPQDVKPPRIETELHSGQPASAPRVIAEERRLVEALRELGYPEPQIRPRSVRINREQGSVDIIYRIACGPRVFFGETVVEGARHISKRYLHSFFRWNRGERFRISLLRETEKRLLDTGVFSLVTLSPAGAAAEGKELPLHMDVIERKRRAVRFGAGYQSDRGPVIAAGWLHRNLWGSAQSFDSSLSLSPEEIAQRTVFTLPRFMDPDTTLVLDLELGESETDAYESRRVRTAAALTHELNERWHVTVSSAYKYSDVEQMDSRRLYNLVFFPMSLNVDYTDSRTDPRSGWRGIGGTSPFLDLRSKKKFLKSYVEGRGYLQLTQNGHYVLAARTGVGVISGTSLAAVPPDDRFYAGGGGSVRGYKYQSIGPRQNDTLVGGLSLLEMSFELRYLPRDGLGYVIFADGGTAYETILPGDMDELKWGFGIGLRYDLGFAPLRFDIGVPLSEHFYDKSLQFYISIGESF